MSAFGNDYHVLFPFGPYAGKKLGDVPEHELAKLKYGPAYEAWVRIQNRRGVTSLLHGPIPPYVPGFVSSDIPGIERNKSVDPAYFGTYIEYLVKYSLGLKYFGTVECYLSHFGFVPVPTHLTSFGPPDKPDIWDRWIYDSYKRLVQKNDKTKYLTDILNMSYCHPMEVSNTFDELAARCMFHYVTRNSHTIEAFVNQITRVLPKLDDKSQVTADKISVGCVIGEIDLIVNTLDGMSIVDVKCCQKDDSNMYAKQLFAYFSLHRLRYPEIPISRLEIWNFLTGKRWVMNVSTIPDEICRLHIRNLGSYHSLHDKLFI